jgi:uncharacterized protein YndB with AHSA1/START domain
MKQKVQVQLKIAAGATRIFRALTQAEELDRWFAEYADVSLHKKRYDFWGRFTPEAPDRERGRHPLLGVEPERRLKFGWRVRGADTTVEISLEPLGPSTLVTLIQEGVPTRRHGQASLADFWDLSVENLRSWVERQTVGARCDFSTPKCGNVHLSIEIDAPRPAVFETLIKSEELERYIAEKATVEPRVGGKYDFGWKGGGPVKILQLVPNEQLAYSWHYENEPDTVVTWTLEGSGGRTKLILVHSGFAPDRVSEDYGTGWLAFLNRIKSLVETGQAWQKPVFSATDYAAA